MFLVEFLDTTSNQATTAVSQLRSLVARVTADLLQISLPTDPRTLRDAFYIAPVGATNAMEMV